MAVFLFAHWPYIFFRHTQVQFYSHTSLWQSALHGIRVPHTSAALMCAVFSLLVIRKHYDRCTPTLKHPCCVPWKVGQMALIWGTYLWLPHLPSFFGGLGAEGGLEIIQDSLLSSGMCHHCTVVVGGKVLEEHIASIFRVVQEVCEACSLMYMHHWFGRAYCLQLEVLRVLKKKK